MKHGRWVLFLVAFIAAFAANGQQAAPRRITPDLETEMRRAGEDAYIRIIIRMQAQLTEADRRKVLAQRGKDGRKALVRALRDYAASAQQGVRADLEKLASAKLVRNVKPLWLSNVIGAEAQPAAIRALAERQDIEYLKQDIKRPAFQATAWGVSQINADDVWTLLPTAYNGSGVLVAILDTGIDLTHSDLQGRLWINTAEDANGDGQFTAADNNGVDDDGNGFVDDVVGWDFGGNDNDPDDWHGHGSHVAGTVAGDSDGSGHSFHS